MDVTPDRAAHFFDVFGIVVLRGLFDPAPLSAELDRALREGFADPAHMNHGPAGNAFRYLPMMCVHTPVSVALAVRLAQVATQMLASPVLPGRAKGTQYRGATQWHRDAELPVRSLGVACYLEPLDADSGALQVLPGSHRPAYAAAIAGYLERAHELPGLAVPTAPGDAIVFDEHLYHASSGGGLRRQWRVDFVADDGDDELLRTYFASQYSPGWDGGYDVDRFPSHGAHWRAIDPWWTRRLAKLGVDALADAEESSVRARRAGPRGM